MQFESKDDFMAHFGVKGMKWGVRKDSSGSAAKASEDHAKVAALRTKPTHSLSNAQLKTINERLQLESTYAELLAEFQPKHNRDILPRLTQPLERRI